MSESPLRTDLIQIEEPSKSREPVDLGLAIGIQFTGHGLRVAIAVGGNVEMIPDTDGVWEGAAIGLDALRDADPSLPETLALAAKLQSALVEISRNIAGRAQRLVTSAVVVIPPDLDRRAMAIIMGSVEGAGLALSGMIDTPVALAYAAGLEHSAPGRYLLQVGGQSYAVLIKDGEIWSEPEVGDAKPVDMPIDPEFAVLGAALLAEIRNAEQL